MKMMIAIWTKTVVLHTENHCGMIFYGTYGRKNEKQVALSTVWRLGYAIRGSHFSFALGHFLFEFASAVQFMNSVH